MQPYVSSEPLHSRPPLQRTWRHSTEIDKEKGSSFRFMTYNILADYLARRHRCDLYRSVSSLWLEWNQRWELIWNEINDLQPDILCLQEVDHFEQIQSDLNQLGYQGLFLRRSGDCWDGCATFWKSSYELMAFSKINFNQTQVLRDNVALICTLKHPEKTDVPQSHQSKNFTLTIANTHILFNPKRGDIKLAQLRILCDEMDRMRHASHADCFPSACIVAGDLNSCPESGIYKFMEQGSVNLTHYTCRDMAGALHGGFGGYKWLPAPSIQNGTTPIITNLSLPPWHPYPADTTEEPSGSTELMLNKGDGRWWPPQLGEHQRGQSGETSRANRLSRTRQSPWYDFHWSSRYTTPRIRARSHRDLLQRFPQISGWSADQLETVMGLDMATLLQWATSGRPENPFTLDHDLHLESAYRSVCGSEPEATSFHDHCKMALDYVFFSPYSFEFNKDKYEFVTLAPCSVLEVPPLGDEFSSEMKMPNEAHGSDHFSLCVDFVCQWTRSYREAGLSLPPPTWTAREINQAIFHAQRRPRRPHVYHPRRPSRKPFSPQSKTRHYKRRGSPGRRGGRDRPRQ